jgi:hypothetical protein
MHTQALLGVAPVGDVLNGADRADRAPPARKREVGLRAHLHPAQASAAIDDAMFDVEGAVTVRIVGSFDGGGDAGHVFRMDVRKNLRERRRFFRIPAVNLAQLERPEDQVALVVVIEDPDVADADRLPQSLISVPH